MTNNNQQKDFVVTIVALGGLEGIRRVHIKNRSGLCIVCPRKKFTESKSRSEFKNSGVYLLIGENENDPSKQMIYIGQSIAPGDRIYEHYKNKGFWQQAILLTTIDRQMDPLNETMLRYIESALITKAEEDDRYVVDNIQSPPDPSSISDEDKIICDDYLNEMMPLLPIIGIDAFSEKRIEKPKGSIKYFYAHNKMGRGYVVEGKRFVVMKGSKARKERKPNLTRLPYYQSLFARIDKFLDNTPGTHYTFKEDYKFNSPSQAASVMTGNLTNGNEYWKAKDDSMPTPKNKGSDEDQPAAKKPKKDTKKS